MNTTGSSFKPFKTFATYKHIQYRDQMPDPKYQVESNVTQIINTSTKNFDPYFQSRQMVEQQLQDEERNNIDFYKIKEIDKVRAKKRENTDFRSIHYITDKPIAASQKLQLYQYKDVLLQRPEEREPLNEFQLQSRQQLKKKDPQKQLLLNEIYAKLSEEGNISKNEQHIQKQKEHLKQVYEPKLRVNYVFKSQQNLEKNKLQQIEQAQEDILRQDLDHWSTINTQHYRNNKQTRLQYFRPARQSQSQGLNNTISRVKKSIVGILSRKNTDSGQQSQQRESTISINDSKRDSFALPGLAKLAQEKKEKEKKEFEQMKKEHEKKKGINKTNQQQVERKSTFNEALQSAIQLVQARKGADIGGDLDRDVKKKLASYMNAIPDGENENAGDIIIDLDSKKIKETLLQRLKLEKQHSTIRSLTKFYEKQTHIIEQQLFLKIREVDSYIQNKTNYIRILRTENHQLQNKLRQIENRMIDLKKELKDGPRKSKKEVTPTAPRKSNTNMKDPQQSSAGFQENRSLLIDKFMISNNYEYSMEDKINEQRQLRQQAEEKIQKNLDEIYQQELMLHQKKKRQKDLVKSKRIFYFELLRIGKDCRQEGIIWIVIYLWCEGEKISQQHLPDFLDQKAKEFIILKSQKQMELQELLSIQDLQMDVYKQNIHNQIEAQNQSQQQKSQFERTPFSTNGFNNYSLLDKQAAIMQEQQQQTSNKINTNSINSIIGQSKMQVTQNLSVINVSQVKQKKSEEVKQRKVENLEQMLQGLTQQEMEVIDCTIDQLTSPKITSNNIFYDETIKKMRENFRVQKTIVPPKQNVKIDDNISEYDDSFEDNSEIILEEDQEEMKQEPMKHNIVLYENEKQMNKYETKQEFFKEQRNLTKKIAQKKKELQLIEEQELSRIIKEFDYKNYLTRFKTKYSRVLGALFGAFKAEREMVRNGLKENNEQQQYEDSYKKDD